MPCERPSLPSLIVFEELQSWQSAPLPSPSSLTFTECQGRKRWKEDLLSAACFEDTARGRVSLASVEVVTPLSFVFELVLAFFVGGGTLLSSPVLPSSSDTSLRGGMRCGGRKRENWCVREPKKSLNVVAALGRAHAWQERKRKARVCQFERSGCIQSSACMAGTKKRARVLSVTYSGLPQWIQRLTNAHIAQLDWPLHKVSTLI